jgi:hypothetical protein
VWWKQLGVTEPEMVRTFRGFNAYAEPFRQESEGNIIIASRATSMQTAQP